MPPLNRVLLLVLGLAGPATAAQPVAPPRDGSPLFIELPAERTGEEPEVFISAGLSTNFNFDAELSRAPDGRDMVELAQREAFSRVDVGQASLRLVPSATLKPGTRLRLRVLFRDGKAPADAAFTLVVGTASPHPVVEVFREGRPVESYQLETKNAHAATAKCLDALERIKAERAGPPGLLGMLASGHITEIGVRSLNLRMRITHAPGSVAEAIRAMSFRSGIEVGVKLQVELPEGAPPWTASGATLTGKQGREVKVLKVWQSAPVSGGPGGGQSLTVGADATEAELQGTYVLKVWEADTGRALVVHNVTFP